jgi:hypothetical protein
LYPLAKSSSCQKFNQEKERMKENGNICSLSFTFVGPEKKFRPSFKISWPERVERNAFYLMPELTQSWRN